MRSDVDIVADLADMHVGKFSIPFAFFEKPLAADGRIITGTEHAANIFSSLRIVPIRAAADYACQRIDYVAICKQFDEIKPGDRIPEYTLFITFEFQYHFERVCENTDYENNLSLAQTLKLRADLSDIERTPLST